MRIIAGNNGNKRICVLREVNRRFNVSPNVDTLLEALERADLEEEVVRAQAQALVRVRLLSSTTTTTSGIDCNLSSSFLG